ncbi:MAG: single-stranded DNA-binding protein [Planctomycetes bacterium]|nr:single-stranded DNA-binding protein [Planctomycetota bacterium]
MNVNRTMLTGRLTKDAKLFEPPNEDGTPRVNLRIAVNGRKKNGDGVWEDDVLYMTAVAWGNYAKTIVNNGGLKVGDYIAVDGKLVPRSWDDAETGQKRFQLQLKVNNLETIAKNGNGSNNRNTNRQEQPSQPQRPATEAVVDPLEDILGGTIEGSGNKTAPAPQVPAREDPVEPIDDGGPW